MNKQTRQQLFMRVACLLAAAVGAWIMLQSTIWGLMMSDSISAQVFSLQGDEISLVNVGPAISIRLIGLVMLSIGLWRALERPGKD